MEAWWSRATPVRGLIRLSGGPTGAGLTVVRSYNSRVEGGGDGKKSHFKSPFVCRSANLIRKVLLFLAGRHSFVCSVFRPPTPASWLWKKPERQHWDHSRVCLLFFCDILMKWFYNIHDNFFFGPGPSYLRYRIVFALHCLWLQELCTSFSLLAQHASCVMSNALIYSSDLPDLCVLASVTSRLLLLTCIFHCCRSNHDDLEGRWIQKRERESQTKGCSLKVWVDIYTFDQLIVEILHLLKWRLWAEQSSEVGVNAEPAFSAALDLDWKHRLGCFAVYILWIEITCFVKPVHDNGCQTRGKGGEKGRMAEQNREDKKRVSQGSQPCF